MNEIGRSPSATSAQFSQTTALNSFISRILFSFTPPSILTLLFSLIKSRRTVPCTVNFKAGKGGQVHLNTVPMTANSLHVFHHLWCICKGQTIRKVMGGGGGGFSACTIFFFPPSACAGIFFAGEILCTIFFFQTNIALFVIY